jgi:PAS domain S-box-containing protein
MKALGLSTFIVIPFGSGRGMRGALCLGSRQERLPDAAGLRMLLRVVRGSAVLLHAARSAQRTREAADRFYHLFSAALDAIFILDAGSGVILDINDHAAALLRLERTAVLHRPLQDLVDARDRSSFAALWSSLQRSGRPSGHHTSSIVRRDGLRVPVEMTVRVVKTGGRRLAIAIARDVTQQKRADVQLAASEELLRIIVEGTLGMFFYVHNTQGVFTYISPSVEKITGHSVHTWKDHYEKFMTDNPLNTAVREHTERALHEGTTPPPYHCEVRHADGRPILLEINEKPIHKDGEVIGVQGVARDITERRQWEQSLMDSEARYRSLFHGVSDGIFSTDRGGVITSINRAGAQILGYESPEELLAAAPHLAGAFAHEEDFRRYRSALAAQGTVRNMEFEGRRAGTDRIVMEISGSCGQRTDGGCDGTLRDVTERKRLEEQLLHSQKMESIGLLAGGIAHDFNNILGGILGYASYLKSIFPPGDPTVQHLETIERSALRAADLTSELLAFARGGKYVIRPININAVVEETLRLLRGSIDAAIIIEQHCEEPLPAIEADAGQMQQVLMNLCVNARDAMPGGGRLSVSTAVDPWQTPFLVSQPDLRHVRHVRIGVADTGVGMARETLARVFEPFFTTKEKGKGTGLGLATVYGIVKNHNGHIRVDSEVGHGTTFTVWFPTVEAEVADADERSAPAAGGSETILVVDDEQTIRSLVADLLGARGYRVLQAAHGREALEIYGREPVDLVILDMMMPEMGGRETFVRLREMNPEVCTILSTGYAQDERARELLSMGVRAFVQKPYRADDLAAAVRGVLDARGQTKDPDADGR